LFRECKYRNIYLKTII